MCSRYTLASRPEAVEREFQAEFTSAFDPVYNACPGMELPVILSGEDSRIVRLRWGLVPYWSKSFGGSYQQINAYAGEVVRHPAFRSPLRLKRCLVPANCYLDWLRIAPGRVPHVVYFGDHRLFSMAGLWDLWIDRITGDRHLSFSLITTHANNRLRPFLRRMPVIIPPSRRRSFLHPGTPVRDIMAMLRPFQSDTVNLYPVSPEINHARTNKRDLLLPVGERLYPEHRYVPRVYLKLEGMGSGKARSGHGSGLKLML